MLKALSCLNKAFCITMPCIVFIASHCIVLHYIALYDLYCTVLYLIVSYCMGNGEVFQEPNKMLRGTAMDQRPN